jgi:hypothetical protein
MKGMTMKQLVICGLAALALALPVHAAAGDTVADSVLGQRRLNTSLPFLIDGRVFSASDVAVDRSATPNRIYLADVDLNRVLGWSDTARFRAGASADLVLGQQSLVTGSFVSTLDECPAPPSPTSFCRPSRVAVDPSGNVYVVDSFNDRVLEFDRPFATDRTADRVFGQPDFISRGRSDDEEAGFSRELLDVAADGAGNVWMADPSGSRRLLEFDNPLTHDTLPDRVIEPAAVEDCDRRHPQDRLCLPYELAISPQGDLYVQDAALFGGLTLLRVFRQPLTTDLTPDFELSPAGFPGLGFDPAGNLYFTSGTALNRLPAPAGPGTRFETVFPGTTTDISGRLDVDTSGNVYTAHYRLAFRESVNFVYAFQPPFQAKPQRLGRIKQPNDGSLFHPSLVAVDRGSFPNHLYAVDATNKVFGWRDAAGFANGAPADLILDGYGPGRRDSGDFCQSISVVVNARRFCVGDSFIQGGMAVDSHGNLWLSDVTNHRVLEFNRPFESDGVADRVLGQKGSFTTNRCNQGGIGAGSLCFPGALAFDGADNLYVADLGNHRVLLFLDPLRRGTAAKVFGQADFQHGDCNRGLSHPAAATLCLGHEEGDINVYFIAAGGLAVDSRGTLYVADPENVRVLAFRNAPSSSGRADAVLGQDGRFATTLQGTGARRFAGPGFVDNTFGPSGLTVSPAGDLYVADTPNDRVLVFTDPLLDDTADRVFGHADFAAGGAVQPPPTYYGNVPPPTAARLLRPSDAAIDAAGNLYVADMDYNRVLRFDRP